MKAEKQTMVPVESYLEVCGQLKEKDKEIAELKDEVIKQFNEIQGEILFSETLRDEIAKLKSDKEYFIGQNRLNSEEVEKLKSALDIEKAWNESGRAELIKAVTKYNALGEIWLQIVRGHHKKHPHPELVKCNRCLIVFGNHWVSIFNDGNEVLELLKGGKG
jgi:predicted nuclease with TOPRIM domain